jgi:hypothetical protein
MRQRFDEERLRTLEKHTAQHNVDRDRELVPLGQYDQFPAGAILIQGNVFAVGAAYLHGRLPAHPGAVAESIEHAFGIAEHYPDSSAHRDGLREWASWIDAHAEPAMDWRDRFFWEEWVGGWSAACEQSADLMEVERVSPANCESVIAAMLRIDPPKRYGKRWQVDLIYRMAPALTDHPYHLGGPFMTRLRWAASAWAHHPRKRRFPIGRMRSLAHRLRAADVGSRI